MTKKQKTTLLLVLVILIWSLIGYHIYKYLHPDVPVLSTVSQKKFVPQTSNSKNKEFTIANYRDPFLGKLVVAKQKGIKKQGQTVVFPQVVYNGIIKGNRRISYIVSINNQQEIMKLGQTIQRIKLVRASSKKITVRFQNTNKTIVLQQ
ncbi:MAG: hypothetical protein P8K77_05410 [Polaribacter sp.]|nr:hypothetical protein [Polaribacter sp.]